MTVMQPPIGTHYRRCWCAWWIVPDAQKKVAPCRVCQVPRVRANRQDFLAVGLTLEEPKKSKLDVEAPIQPEDNTDKNETIDLWEGHPGP